MSEQRLSVQRYPDLAIYGSDLDCPNKAKVSRLLVGTSEVCVDTDAVEIPFEAALSGVLASAGVEDSEIAQKLQLHERTVKTHVETVREIAGVSARSGLARYFFDTGAYLCNSMSPKALDIWPQELLVLKKISYAKTNDEIAEALCLNPYMARKHCKNMTRHTGWRGRERLALAGFAGGNIGEYALHSAEVLATANEV